MKKSVFLLSLAAGLSGANAVTVGGNVSGYVSVSDTAGPVLLVKLDSSSVEGCNTSGRFAISSTDTRYKATLAAVMAAYHAQSPVKVVYNQTCTAWSNSYDMSYVCVGGVGC